MRRSDEYRDLAQECVDWARSAKSEHERKFFLQIAEAWRQAALVASQREDRKSVPRIFEAHTS